jgi:probable O-glycosylation ligase (exosortase A-associated)
MFFAQYQREGRLFLDRSRQTGLLLIFIVAVMLSVPFAYWRVGALTGLVEMLKLLALYLLVVQLVDSRRRLRIYLLVLGLLTVHIAGGAFLDYLRGASHHAQGIDRAIGETSIARNPNQLGTTLAVTVPPLLLLALYRPLRRWRILFGLATLLCVITMALTGSRASLLGFLAGMGYLWWRSRRRLLLATLALPLLVASFVALPDQYRVRYGTLTSGQLDPSSQGRVATWISGLHMVIDRPLFGVGIACFGTAHATDYSSESIRNWMEPHSLYVQVFAELGLVGGAVFALLFIEFFRLNRRVTRRLAAAGDRWSFERTILQGLFTGFVVLIVSGVFGHSLTRYTWYVYSGLGLCILRLYLSETEVTLPADAGSLDAPGSRVPGDKLVPREAIE